MSDDKCDSCKADYNYTAKNAEVRLFIDDPLCNHVLAKCPKCGAQERIFITAAAFHGKLLSKKLGLVFGQADDELRAKAASCWGIAYSSPATAHVLDGPKEVPVPREWVRQLHDDLRRFGKGER